MEWIRALAPIFGAIIAGVITLVVALIAWITASRKSAEEAKFKYVGDVLQFRIRQINEFYGPMLLQLEQSRRVYEKLLRTIRQNPDINVSHVDFRLLDHLPVLMGDGRTAPLVQSILDIGSNMVGLLRDKAGLIEGGMTGTYIDYVSHYEILRASEKQPASEQASSGWQEYGYYPTALNREVKAGYAYVMSRLQGLLDATDDVVSSLMNFRPTISKESFSALLANLHYYEQHSRGYAKRYDSFDLDSIREVFLSSLPPSVDKAHTRILDAGCGTGRDTAAFIEKGYAVTAFDLAPSMVNHCNAKIMQLRESRKVPTKEAAISSECIEASFEEVDFFDEYHGIWASASLLHVPKDYFVDVLRGLVAALRTEGTLYISLLYGYGEHRVGGRYFANYSMGEVYRAINECEDVRIAKSWLTDENARSIGKIQELWLKLIMRIGFNKRIWINLLIEKL